LVGISRTMKTPVMLYLAYRGWYAANVPIVFGVPLPRELLKIPPKRVFCLTMTPNRLLELRRTRADTFNIPEEPYASLTHIRQELIHARRLCQDYGWRQLEVTGQSVEEVARQVITLLAAKGHRSSQTW
jgi:[pyruvate, water dikinase]-phosphate phosphotransferase / [pyruvate, water dikinase] kinase